MPDKQVQLDDDGWCFACGPDNPHGLQLADFRWEQDAYVCQFTPRRQHQGWKGLTHGGLIATLLDEVMTRMLWQRDTLAMTAELAVRYLQPAPVGETLTVRGTVQQRRGKLIAAHAEVVRSDGTIVATAQAKLVMV